MPSMTKDRLFQTIHDLLHKRGPEVWSSKRIRYHKPYVDRLAYDLGNDQTVFLHRLHPCEAEEALVHPHPWPADIWRLKGFSDMGLFDKPLFGALRDVEEAPILQMMMGGRSFYRMHGALQSHYDAPQEEAFSIMLVGRPFTLKIQNPFPHRSGPLGPGEKTELWEQFRDLV